VFRFFETLVAATGIKAPTPAPNDLIGFYWHFIKQARWPFLALLMLGLCAALVDLAVPVSIGRIVNSLSGARSDGPLIRPWQPAAVIAMIVFVLRPLVATGYSLTANQALRGSFSNLVLWQSHLQVVRQSWSFFQNDFAGRISDKVMQTGPSLLESVIATVNSAWYIFIYGTSAVVILAKADIWLALPLLLWFVGYLAGFRYFLPRVFVQAQATAEARSVVAGRIIDTYSNILTVKLFSGSSNEGETTRAMIDAHTTSSKRHFRLVTQITIYLSILNGMLLIATAGPVILLSARGNVSPGTVAMVIPLVWQLSTVSGTIAFQVAAVFQNIGIVRQGKETIARPLQLVDRPNAPALLVRQGQIRFESVRFGYRKEAPVINDLTLNISAGEKIGLIGRSGAGKSTLINLLLRFFDVDGGRVLIDDQDIASVSQDSLRAAISVVTQDTSLLHRSIKDNILCGRTDASDLDIIEAARRSEAHEFILTLTDQKGRRAYNAHIGERGVTLSGGQRQRIAIARLLLKDSPILILDEATSALDSEAEAAIQASLETLTKDKTVIAIAHRLSTIARMDRLIVIDKGRVVEEGSHVELLRLDGHYSELWRRQSQGFLDGHADGSAALERSPPSFI
jgi:ATP-binding cassette, subfamily B, multidrug efflux pump